MARSFVEHHYCTIAALLLSSEQVLVSTGETKWLATQDWAAAHATYSGYFTVSRKHKEIADTHAEQDNE